MMVALQETVAVPEPITLLGAMVVHMSPDGTVSLRLTDPAKRFTGATVIVELAEPPAFIGAGEMEAIVKSMNWKLTVALWMSGVLAPVILAV